MIHIYFEQDKKNTLIPKFKIDKKATPEMWATLLLMIGKEGDKFASLIGEHLSKNLSKKDGDTVGGLLVMMNKLYKKKEKLSILEIAKTPIFKTNIITKGSEINEG